MKKKLLVQILAGMMAMAMVCGCGTAMYVEKQADASQSESAAMDDTDPARLEVTGQVTEDKEFGGVYVKLNSDDLREAGFEFGDSCTVEFENGYRLENVPFFSGYYTKTNEALIVDYKGYEYITIQRAQSDGFWKEAQCQEDEQVTIRVTEKGTYLDMENTMSLIYSNDPEDYDSAVEFANFRVMEGGNLAENTFYRGASPVDNKNNRAEVVDEFLEENQIGYVLDLADTEERLAGYQEKEGFDSDYYMSLYDQDQVGLLGLTASYRSADFREKLVNGLRDMMQKDGPYYIHCTEGKDRTGFVCILVECMAGFSAEEIEADYMKTYENYYGITKEDTTKYNVIMEQKYYDMMLWLTGCETDAELEQADFEAATHAYLLSGGMTEAEYTDLLGIVLGK